MGMFLAIGLGGALGALGRYFLSGQVVGTFGSGFPWGVLAVNVLGCFAMGVITELAVQSIQLTPEWRAFLTTGLLGGFTTFSAFAMDFAVLAERNEVSNALFYVAGSVGGSILALFLGLYLVRTMYS